MTNDNKYLIRSYNSGEEGNIIKLWNASLPHDQICQGVFNRKILLDPNFDPAGLIIAEEIKTQELIGFIYCITRKLPVDADGPLEPEKGWIPAMGVRNREWMNVGVGQALMEAAETYFKGKERQMIIASSYSPNYFFQGIDRDNYPANYTLFEVNGYKCIEESVSMGIDLYSYVTPDSVLEKERELEREGYKFCYLRVDQVISLFKYIKQYHSPGWVRLVRVLLHSTDDWERVSVVTYCDEVVGFNRFSDPDLVIERFGPFGVKPDLRGKGIGKVLLARCLDTMKRKGVHFAWFQWTNENSAADTIYKKAGFRVIRRYFTMMKDLDYGAR
jgi:GNAT superfamily N-acetyltransferase